MSTRTPQVPALNQWKVHTFAFTAVLMWTLAVAEGIRQLVRYSTTPGDVASPPLNFTQRASFHLESGGLTLLVFAHPKCPCSRATIDQLAAILARSPHKPTTYVLFYVPQTEADKWARTSLWHDAAAIPGVGLIMDRGGREARRFKVSTSGQTLLYSKTGSLLFNGGITRARGHAGWNKGSNAVLELIRAGRPSGTSTPAYGCSLLGAL